MAGLVFLIGYRGTGKTTVAPLVAAHLGWDWLDADEELERRSGLSIRGLIDREGEPGFRDREAGLLAEFCGRDRLVVATGGGVVLRPDNRDCLRAAGRVVWLTADADTLWQRLCADPATPERRPALGVGGRAEIEEALGFREPLYRASAHATVATAGRSPAQVALDVLNHLGILRF